MNEKLAAILRHNAEVCAAEMRRLNIAGVEIDYSGEGDSGNGVDIFLIDESGSAIDAETGLLSSSTVVYRQVDHDYGWREDACFGDAPLSLDEALEDLCCLAIECFGHSGYENNDGGGGTLRLKASSGELELKHYDNVVHQEYSSHRV
jgi:hypothetical protein